CHKSASSAAPPRAPLPLLRHARSPGPPPAPWPLLPGLPAARLRHRPPRRVQDPLRLLSAGTERPVSVLVFSRRATSSAAMACHAVASLPVVEIVAAFTCNPPLGPCRLVARGPYLPEAILSDSARRQARYRAVLAHASASRPARAVAEGTRCRATSSSIRS